MQFWKGYLVQIGVSGTIGQPVFAQSESLSIIPPENCESLLRIKAYPDFLVVITRTRFMDRAIDFVVRINNLVFPDRFFPIFLIIQDNQLLLFKCNKICIVLPKDLSLYKMLLLAYNAGVDAVDNTIDNIKIYGHKIVKFYQNYKKINAYRHLSCKTEQNQANLDYLFQLAELVETYDNYPVSHIRLMGRLAFDICNILGFSNQDSKDIATAVKLHDIGKLFIPKQLLGNSVVVSREEEWEIFHKHTTEGAKFIQKTLTQKNNLRTKISNVVLYHHENNNGSGYPAGLKGSHIPVEAKIARILDIFDSLQRKRAYRTQEIDQRTLITSMIESSEECFDQEILNAFMKIISKQSLHQFFSEKAESALCQFPRD